VPELQRLRADHAPAVLAFELANRVYFAASIYVLVTEDGSVQGRFNLYFTEDGVANVGYRVAQHVAGRGVATATVRELCGLAATQYGLRTLKAATSCENAASQKVLARAGFIPVGPADPADLGGKQGTWYQRDLVQPLSSSLLARGYAMSRSCGLGEVLLPGWRVGIGVVAPLAAQERPGQDLLRLLVSCHGRPRRCDEILPGTWRALPASSRWGQCRVGGGPADSNAP
jgi:ribosomal-protein-alanine N-acetyltransferase